MTDTLLPYPEHIYDENRMNLALTIIEKESRKLFLNLPSATWERMDESMRGWTQDPVRYHLENDGPRDFWDIFAAFMESVKLKPNFTALITAENVTWHRALMSIRDIQMTIPLAQLKKVPELNLRNNLPYAELADVLARKPHLVDEQKQLVDQYSTDPAQDTYPVVLKEAKDGLFKVMDGNRRTLKTLLYGEDKIEAWVCSTNGDEPTNYWVPLNDMFQLLKVYKQAVDIDDKELQKAVARVLKARFEASDVAKIAYRCRIGNQAKIASEFYELTQNL